MRIKLSLSSGCQFSFRIVLSVILLTLSVSVQSAYADPGDSNPKVQESTKKLLKRAKKQLRKGLLSESAKTINRAIAADPMSNAAKLSLSYVYLKQRKFVSSYDLAFEIAEKDPKNSYAFAILGTHFLSAGNFREARILLNNSLILNKREALAWASLGMLEFHENRVRQGILNLRQAVYHDRLEADFEYALAQLSSRGEQYAEAAKAYERFLRIAPRSDKERRDRIKGLIRYLKYLGKRDGLYSLAGEKATVVKTKIVNNRPIVPVRLKKNGEILNFVLDTGSGITVISKKTAKKFGIRSVAKGGVARALGGDGKFEIVYGFLNTFRIGDVKIRNVPVYIREFQRSNIRIDGYIGLSVISRYVTTVDYEKGLLSLEQRQETIELPSPKGALTVPLRMTSSGFLSGNVKLSGVEDDLHFILDTGASVSVVSEDVAEMDAVRPNIMKQRMRVFGAAGVTENVPMYMLRDLDFGGIMTPELRAVALDLDMINETSGFVQAGILGGNFLKDYKLTFDFQRSKVTLVPN